MFHYNSLLKRMQKLTGMHVEIMATMELIIYLENLVDEITMQSVNELEQLNKLRKIQGLYQKNRIDRLCITSAIKHLSEKGVPRLK